MLISKSHQGIERPVKKNDLVSLPTCFKVRSPSASERVKYDPMMTQSRVESIMLDKFKTNLR